MADLATVCWQVECQTAILSHVLLFLVRVLAGIWLLELVLVLPWLCIEFVARSVETVVALAWILVDHVDCIVVFQVGHSRYVAWLSHFSNDVQVLVFVFRVLINFSDFVHINRIRKRRLVVFVIRQWRKLASFFRNVLKHVTWLFGYFTVLLTTKVGNCSFLVVWGLGSQLVL